LRSWWRQQALHQPSNFPLHTLLYIDGLKRVVLTKKEAEMLQRNEKVYGLTVSGKVEFDALGRTVAQGQPLFKSVFQTPFVWQMTSKNPTRFTYDLLGRTTLTVLPDPRPRCRPPTASRKGCSSHA
jgi:hypothetical protein